MVVVTVTSTLMTTTTAPSTTASTTPHTPYTMSDEFRRSILNRLPPMAPTKAPWATDGDDDEEEEEELADSLGELGNPSSRNAPTFTPLSAADFFEQALEVTPDGSDATFRAYLTEPRPKAGKGTYVLAHHGGGASALSFAALARDVSTKSSGELGFFSFDARGHGKTRVTGQERLGADLSLEVLVSDFVAVVRHVFPDPRASPSFLVSLATRAVLSDTAAWTLDGRCADSFRRAGAPEARIHCLRGGRARRR